MSETSCRGELPIRQRILKSTVVWRRVAKGSDRFGNYFSNIGRFGNELPNRGVDLKTYSQI
eukprot:2485503-Pyramimonas_sp.AAC.1